MSVHVLSWVLKHSEAKLGARLALLVLADHAKDDGSMAWPSVETIAREARLSKRAARDALRRLEDEGAIEKTGVSRRGTSIYSVLMGGEADSAGRQITTESVSSSSSEPSFNRPLEETSPNGEGKNREHPEFGQWLGHHHRVTGMTVLGAGTAGRKKIAGMFGARLAEGFSRDDLELATEGAFADDFRREHGHFDPESVLRPTKVAKLVDAGRRARAAAVEAGERGDKWAQFEADNAAAQGRAA